MDLWGAMSDETQEQPSWNYFIDHNACLLDNSYWPGAAADHTDLFNANITGVSKQRGDG